MAKENSIKMKRKPTVWKNILLMIPQKEFDLQNILKNSTPGRQTTQLKNGQNT